MQITDVFILLLDPISFAPPLITLLINPFQHLCTSYLPARSADSAGQTSTHLPVFIMHNN